MLSCQVDTSNLGYLTWYVNFEPGQLEAVARDVSHKLETVSAPVQIKLVPCYELSDSILQVEAYILDEIERVVISDRSLIAVKVEGDGELIGLDNGDLADVTDYTAPYRSAYEGKLMIYVRRISKGAIKISASNPYLKSAELVINS